MIDLYPDEQYMLKFTNHEIMNYLVEPITAQGNHKFNITMYEKKKGEKERIFSIEFVDENIEILFYEHLIGIFVFDEEIMFFDDHAKEELSGSETYHNVVYEGTLRDKTHEQILNMIYKVFMILEGTKKIMIEETVYEQIGIHYPKCRYIVKLTQKNVVPYEIILENIHFRINK
ncbi:hypothetical protein [Anaerosporobacter faecicola]|uniref:hypothetical protein n=1 Tax=Anaerosporobacter faecicola TaxID=2718714 RepID=UPI00143B5A51|nr:hypothetical protein [Anaerosporobacter faecicola]